MKPNNGLSRVTSDLAAHVFVLLAFHHWEIANIDETSYRESEADKNQSIDKSIRSMRLRLNTQF